MVDWELFIPVAVLAVLIHTIVGLLAIWIGLGRAHWFFGTAVLGGLLALGVLVGAYEPVVVFFLQAVIVLPEVPIDPFAGQSWSTCRHHGGLSPLQRRFG